MKPCNCTEFILKHIIKITLGTGLVLSFFVLSDFWVNILNTWWVEPVMSKIDTDFKAWWVVGVLGGIVTWYYISAWRTEKLWNKTRFLIVIIPSALYVLCRCSPKWDFTPIWGFVYFADFVLLPLFIEAGMLCRRCKKVNTEYDGLVYCTPKDAPDNYGRDDYLAALSVEIVKSFPHDQSFATGITGEWGTGKSWFLESLERKIVKKDSSIVVIKFAPWSCNTPSEIISEFFELYKREISVIVPSISSIIDRYVDALLDAADNGVTKFIKALYHPNGRGQSYNYDKIKACLTKAQLKVLVVVDDLDRLHGPEIMEVLTLIRNTANFPYTHFLVAYDKGYVIHAMTEAKVDRPEQYLEKIFNFEVPLPKFEPKAICMELHKEIGSILQEQIKEKEIKGIIYEGITEGANERTTLLIPQILQTRRDVIRFSNSFLVNWKACTTKEMCIKDFFYLELIRYGFPKFYTTLRDNPTALLKIEGSYYCAKEQLSHIHSEDMEMRLQQKYDELNNMPPAVQGLPDKETLPRETRDDKIAKQKEFLSPNIDNIDDRQRSIIVTLLHRLFSTTAPAIKNLSNISSNFSYFAYRADNMTIYKADMNAAITTNTIPDRWNYEDEIYPNEVRDKLEEVIKDSTNHDQEELREKILEFLRKTLDRYSFDYEKPNDFTHVEHEVFNSLLRFLYHNNHPLRLPVYFMKLQLELLNHIENTPDQRISGVFHSIMGPYEQNELLEKYNISDADIDQIKQLLINTQCPANVSPLITRLITNPSKTLIIPVEELKEIQMNYLRNHVKNENEAEVSPNTMTLLYQLIKSIPPETELVQIEPEALKIVHDFIIMHPKGYIKLFAQQLGASSSENYGTIAPEPFYKQIFESNDEFEVFILNSEFDGYDKINLARNLWKLYKANDYKYLSISDMGPITELMNNNLQPLMDRLQALQKLRVELDKLLTAAFSSEELNYLEQQLERNYLPITYYNNIHERVNELKRILI